MAATLEFERPIKPRVCPVVRSFRVVLRKRSIYCLNCWIFNTLSPIFMISRWKQDTHIQHKINLGILTKKNKKNHLENKQHLIFILRHKTESIREPTNFSRLTVARHCLQQWWGDFFGVSPWLLEGRVGVAPYDRRVSGAGPETSERCLGWQRGDWPLTPLTW